MNKPKQNKYYIDLIRKIETRKVNIGIIGIGYVGLPLALSFSSKGIKVIGFDINEEVIKTLKEGRSHINHVDSKEVERGIKSQSFLPTQDFSLVKNLIVKRNNLITIEKVNKKMKVQIDGEIINDQDKIIVQKSDKFFDLLTP